MELKKDFDDFMESMNNKNWSAISQRIKAYLEKVDMDNEHDIVQAIALVCIDVNTVILKEYHNWLHRN